MKNADWWVGLMDVQIEALKTNKVCLGLCDEWMKEAIINGIQSEELLRWGGPDRGWLTNEESVSNDLSIYRLKPAWEKPGSKGDWEICDVYAAGRSIGEVVEKWHFDRNTLTWTLCDAFEMVGFGGVEYKEEPGHFHRTYPMMVNQNEAGTLEDFSIDPEARMYRNIVPATPSRVCFFVGKKK